MVKFYKNINGVVTEIEQIEQDSWISLVKPSKEEIDRIQKELNIPPEFLHSALDVEEKSRVEVEDDIRLIVVEVPTIDNDMPEYEAYDTFPLSIIVTPTNVITVCTRETSVLNDITGGRTKNIQVHFKTRFVFQILMKIAHRFLLYLKKIEKASTNIERQLNETLKNEELLQLLALSKSLTYFSASLKSNEATLRKLLRGHIVKLYEEDRDLLEDAIIEFTQAVDMANSYSAILKATMETYSSVASNNLNIIMKVLAVITIVMAVPEIVFGFYGMNVLTLPFDQFTWFPIVISVVGALILWFAIRQMKFYK